MAALDTLLQKVPKKVLVFLIGVLALVLAFAVLVQKRPVDVWGLRLGESVEDVQRKLTAAETELRGRSAQAETRAQDLLREIDHLKRTVAELQATAQKATTTSDLLRRSETEVSQLRAQIADLTKRARETENALSEWQKKYEASAGRVKSLSEELDSIRRTSAEVFTVLVSGTYQRITVIEGEGIRGESTTLGGTGLEKTIAVPKDRPILLRFTKDSNTNVVGVPRSVSARLAVEDNGRYNSLVELK